MTRILVVVLAGGSGGRLEPLIDNRARRPGSVGMGTSHWSAERATLSKGFVLAPGRRHPETEEALGKG